MGDRSVTALTYRDAAARAHSTQKTGLDSGGATTLQPQDNQARTVGRHLARRIDVAGGAV